MKNDTSGLLKILLLKPSHYDDDGYVIQWWRNLVPLQTLAVLNGIIHSVDPQRLGDKSIRIEVKTLDETACVIDTAKEIKWLKKAQKCAVFFAGVQTGQFPRAIDLACDFKANHVPCVIGGFHVSGVISMVPDWTHGLSNAVEKGISLYAGELEEGVYTLLNDIWTGNLKPQYNYLDNLTDLNKAPLPQTDLLTTAKTVRKMAGMDLGRGCPYSCSFCTIINVQGRKPRQRTAIQAAEYVRQCLALGIHHFLISDDNFARNKNWESIFDEFIKIREEGIFLDLFIQIDVLAGKMPGFIDKAIRAGAHRVFIGIETVRDDNLHATDKRQNKKIVLKDVVQAWKNAGAIVYCGYIIGLPNDTPERVEEDIKVLMEEVPVDIPEFTLFTPLPGSADHKKMLAGGIEMDKDFNRYDAEHVVCDHPLMSREEWQKLYWNVWEKYFTDEHVLRLIKRGIVCGCNVKELFKSIMGFYAAVHFDRIHPLQSGLFRRKIRTSRRRGYPVIPAWLFYPYRVGEVAGVQIKLLAYTYKMYRLLWKAKHEVKKEGYIDRAITAVIKTKTIPEQSRERYKPSVTQ